MFRKIITLSINDLKIITRDGTLFVIFFIVPFLVIALTRFGVPAIAASVDGFSDYYAPLAVFMLLQMSILYGFITGFLLLEEKDEGVLPVLKIMPFSSTSFLLYRSVFPFIFAFLFTIILINSASWINIKGIWQVLAAFFYGLLAPVILLVLGTLAKNKIEGLALFKGINILVLLPIAGFFLGDIFQYFLMIIPMYWTYNMVMDVLVGDLANASISAGISLGMHLLLLWGLWYGFRKKVF